MSLQAAAHKKHCVCNGEDLGLAAHSCTQVSDWKPLTLDVMTDHINLEGNVAGKTVPSGNYYLPEDLSMSSMLIVPEGVNITICLNGHNITAASKRVSYVAGTLTLTDCAGGAVVSGNIAQNGGCIKLLNGSTVNIYGGTYKNPKKDATGGGVIAISTDSGSVVNNSTKKTTTLNMYGGTLSGGKTSGN